MINKEDGTTLISVIIMIVILALLILLFSGCTAPKAGNANATNPVVNPVGNNNQVDVDTTSETDQRALAGNLVSGDAKTNTNQIFGLSKENTDLILSGLGASICFVVFVVLMALLVELKLRTMSDWIIFATAIAVLITGVVLVMSLGGGE